ncbi:MAG: ABC transporter substrate-binding protein [Myxococcales bacterium]|nr:ABC transporter substrate-binding protein [Myxococcales bacterium]
MGKESERPDGKRLVKTEITATRRGGPYSIEVEYVLARQGKSWQASDVATDGVGLVENYRAQVQQHHQEEGL